MALDLTGIDNVEFYSGHYLDAVLEGDLKSLFQTWTAQKEAAERKRLPQEELAALAQAYFEAAKHAADERGPLARWQAARAFHASLLEALGYPRHPAAEPLDATPTQPEAVVPVLLALERDGHPDLWVIETGFSPGEDDDPLDAMPLPEQLPQDDAFGPGASPAAAPPLPRSDDDGAGRDAPATWRELLDRRIFRLDRPPRWVLFLAGREAMLLERNRWPQGRLLRFDFGELFRRRQAVAMRAMAALLHRDALSPESGVCLHDTLEESSHKHAFAVSGDLKHGVRRAVELLANEVVWYRREKQKKAVFDVAPEFASVEEFAACLTQECLVWLYRLLFLFYVEARGGELDVVSMRSDVYRKGYSLETLRDLELVPLTSEKARNGTFLHRSLEMLFRVLDRGFPPEQFADGGEQAGQIVFENAMRVEALRSPLFDDSRLRVLPGVKLRNAVVQEILRLLSLSSESRAKRHGARGRISYAQLGINQLGAVYEGLLSYTGFFAAEDLYEVANAAENEKLSGKPAAAREELESYFVPESRIGDYEDAEIVRDENGRKVKHPRGTFLFRLAGRNREKSASYYTPEVLTRCVVQHALEELLWERDDEWRRTRRKKSADEILELALCEPAMGSSAFLVEAIDQLAEAYLAARQEELAEHGIELSPERYQEEKRRVMARLATNNCYGVDLNPTAVELARVSLWLATIHRHGKCPWFGLRLASGNSLVGARREVFDVADLVRKGSKTKPNWLGTVPKPAPLRAPDAATASAIDERWAPPPRPQGTVYHFLVPADGMAPFDKEKVVRELAPEASERIKAWRKEFTAQFTKTEAERLERLSDAVDRLFAQVARERVLATRESSDRILVWGEPIPFASGEEGVRWARTNDPNEGIDERRGLLVRDQEEVARALEHESSAYRRLKLVMDAWCALWFWPIEKAHLLPSRETWFLWLELLLLGEASPKTTWEQLALFEEELAQPELPLVAPVPGTFQPSAEAEKSGERERLARLRKLSEEFRETRAHYLESCGVANVDRIVAEDEALQAVVETAEEHRFHHWELRFAEVFAVRGGFDLIVGNPPWILVSFNEQAVIGDFEPAVAIRKLSASQVAKTRDRYLADPEKVGVYRAELEAAEGQQAFLGSATNYPLLVGMKTNLYKCFLARALHLAASDGIAGFLHQQGLYDDPRGGAMREALYPRLRLHAHFLNKLLLFPDVEHQKHFDLTVFAGEARPSNRFRHISNALHPSIILLSTPHDGVGPVPGLKDSDGTWDLRGHLHRLVAVDGRRLALFASLYDEPGTPPLQARLPVVHSREILHVLERFAAQPRRLGDLKVEYFATQHWNETNAQQDGTVRRETRYPKDVSEWIVQGPHFYIATPFNKTPNEGCKHNLDYTAIDLTAIPDDYLPRTNYVPACDAEEYRRRTPKWRGRPVTEYWRYAHREMVSPTGERTLVPTLLPLGVGHVHTVFSLCFENAALLAEFSGYGFSLLHDFFIKTTGKGHVNDSVSAQLPIPMAEALREPIIERALALCCLTRHFDPLLEELGYRRMGDGVRGTPQTVDQPSTRLEGRYLRVLRTDRERRRALVELDVLGAMGLGVGLSELIGVYRAQFPVLQEYERALLYDQHGRIVPTSKTASGNPAVNLVALAQELHEQTGFDTRATYHAGDPALETLLQSRVKISSRDAEILGVPERCTLADLLAETEVRWYDDESPEGRPVRLLGLRYTDPGLEPRLERIYPTPWTRCDREEDYKVAWAEFERRLSQR